MIAELGLYCIPYLWLSWYKQLCCEAFPRQVLSTIHPTLTVARGSVAGPANFTPKAYFVGCYRQFMLFYLF